MRALEILREKIGSGIDFLHDRRAKAFWRGVSGLMNGGQLWLTALGRSLPGACEDKHRIKAADRLLGNKALHRSLVRVYGALARFVLHRVQRPVVAVDWTAVSSDFHALSATVCFSGRALPLLTCVYPNRRKCSPGAQREFLSKLVDVVPRSCTPVIVTDAGFYASWFENVLELGWDFLGRVRNKHYAKYGGEWVPVLSLYEKAGSRPKNLGTVPLRIKHTRLFRFVLSARRKTKGRKRLTRNRTVGRSTKDRQRTDQARQPWLLATSLEQPARVVVGLYAKRMQIEGNFRDMKSHRYGWSLEDVRCRSAERVEMLLLIAAFAAVATHAVGLAAEKRNLQRGLQANTIRKRRVLSTFYLGRLIQRYHRASDLQTEDLLYAFRRLAKIVHASAVPTG